MAPGPGARKGADGARGRQPNQGKSLEEVSSARAAAEEAKAEEERQRCFAQETEASVALQRIYRAWKVRRAFGHLALLEDLVLMQPTPGMHAVERLIPTPRPVAEEEASDWGTSSWDRTFPKHSQKLEQLLEDPEEEAAAAATDDLTSATPMADDLAPVDFGSSAQSKFPPSRPTPTRSQVKPEAVPELSLPGQLGGTAPKPSASRKLSKSGTSTPQHLQQASSLSQRSQVASGRRQSSKKDSVGSGGGRSARVGGGGTQRSSRMGSKVDFVDNLSIVEEEPEPTIDVEALTHQFAKVQAIEDPRKTAEAIMWLLSAEALTSKDFVRIAAHHRLRRRNIHSRVRLRLTLVQHGKARSGVAVGAAGDRRTPLGSRARAEVPDAETLPPTPASSTATHDGILNQDLASDGWTALASMTLEGTPPAKSPPPTASSTKAPAETLHLQQQELTPEGWAQVTRTAWSMRLCLREFSPSLVLIGGTQCCAQTAARLRALADDAADDALAAAEEDEERGYALGGTFDIGSSSCSGGPSAREEPRAPRLVPHPEALHCAELDYPESASVGISPMVFNLTQAVAKAVAASQPEDEDRSLDDPPVVMMVAGGAILEALISCLNTGLAPLDRLNVIASGRLGGGDAVLLESPIMLRIVGETEEDERVRPPEELWEEALRKDGWKVVRHITGDGRQPWGEPKELHKPDVDPLLLEEQFTIAPPATRDEWNRYCGAPLILSRGEFSELCSRAGSVYEPIGKVTLQRLRPLVNDSYRPHRPRKFV